MTFNASIRLHVGRGSWACAPYPTNLVVRFNENDTRVKVLSHGVSFPAGRFRRGNGPVRADTYAGGCRDFRVRAGAVQQPVHLTPIFLRITSPSRVTLSRAQLSYTTCPPHFLLCASSPTAGAFLRSVGGDELNVAVDFGRLDGRPAKVTRELDSVALLSIVSSLLYVVKCRTLRPDCTCYHAPVLRSYFCVLQRNNP